MRKQEKESHIMGPIDTERVNQTFAHIVGSIDTKKMSQVFAGSVVRSDILPTLKSVGSQTFRLGELPTFGSFTGLSDVLSGSVTVRGLDEAVRLVPKTLGFDVESLLPKTLGFDFESLLPKTPGFGVDRLSTAGRADMGAVHSGRPTIGAVRSRRALNIPVEEDPSFDEGLLTLILHRASASEV